MRGESAYIWERSRILGQKMSVLPSTLPLAGGVTLDKLLSFSHLRHLTCKLSLTRCCVCVLRGVQLFETPWAVACQAPLSSGFSRQEYWSGLPFPAPGDLPDPGIKPTFLASPALAGGFFTTLPPGKPQLHTTQLKIFCINRPTWEIVCFLSTLSVTPTHPVTSCWKAATHLMVRLFMLPCPVSVGTFRLILSYCLSKWVSAVVCSFHKSYPNPLKTPSEVNVPASKFALGISQVHLTHPSFLDCSPPFLRNCRDLCFPWLESPCGVEICVPHTGTVCSTSITQVCIVIIYNFALLSDDVWWISWMNRDCNCWGYWALSANYWAQMIAFKYSSQRTRNKKQLAQFCQWISLLPPMGLSGRGGRKAFAPEKINSARTLFAFQFLSPLTSIFREPPGLAFSTLL